MKSITRQKGLEEIERLLAGTARVFIVGCGTCTTATKTGLRVQSTRVRKGEVAAQLRSSQ